MASLKIQVLGRGMIPRGFGLAPRKQPFNADKTMIGTILQTSGLKVFFINPDNNKLEPVTSRNLAEVWKKYSDRPVDVSKVDLNSAENTVNEQQKKDDITTADTNTKADDDVVPVVNEGNTQQDADPEPDIAPVINEEKKDENTATDDNVAPVVPEEKKEEGTATDPGADSVTPVINEQKQAQNQNKNNQQKNNQQKNNNKH